MACASVTPHAPTQLRQVNEGDIVINGISSYDIT